MDYGLEIPSYVVCRDVLYVVIIEIGIYEAIIANLHKILYTNHTVASPVDGASYVGTAWAHSVHM